MQDLRTLARRLAAVAVLIAAAIAGTPAAHAAADPAEKPNVVLILADDQPRSTMHAMPLTNELLGEQGVEFTRHYNNWPLCCPARATLLTGQYPHNNGVRGNQPPNGSVTSLKDAGNTLPVWLQRAGYRTIHIGKYLNGHGFYNGERDIPPGWSDWHGLVDWTTYRMWGYTTNDNGTLNTYGTFEDEVPELYQTRVLGQKARDAIETAHASGQPFFMQFAPTTVHFEMPLGDGIPVRSDPIDRGKMADAPLPDDPSIDEADISDKPLFWRGLYNRRMTAEEIERARVHYAGILEALISLDREVARLVDTLRETGELDNTYILYTSDNGYFHGEHRIPTAKYFLYEPSAHLPLLMRGPGVAQGEQTTQLTQDVDMAATILDMADAEPGRLLDGHSMLPYGADPAGTDERALYFSVPQTTLAPGNYFDFDMDGPVGSGSPDVLSPEKLNGVLATLAHPDEVLNEGDQELELTRPSGGPLQRIAPGIQGVRTKSWIYWEYDMGVSAAELTGDVELYNLVRDPFQLQNLAHDPGHAHVVAAMRSAIRSHHECDGGECVFEMGDPALP